MFINFSYSLAIQYIDSLFYEVQLEALEVMQAITYCLLPSAKRYNPSIGQVHKIYW
ncbi:hypothetical protein PN466_02255 [Roseofilum reptotaenium CS-1145]|nr:hypothetical protein [Roseofilum reptotaenium CS-1145]